MSRMTRRRRSSIGGLSKRTALRLFFGGFVALRTGFIEKAEIPGEPGEWMELRLLGWKDLDAARRERESASFDSLRRMGGDLYKMLQESRSDDGTAAADPLLAYDLGTLLVLGIAGWSYDAPVNAETVGQLDPQTAEWAARRIIGEKTESKADQKND